MVDDRTVEMMAAFSLTLVAWELTFATSSVTTPSFSILVGEADRATQLLQDRDGIVPKVPDREPEFLEHPTELQQRNCEQRDKNDSGQRGDESRDLP